jgi:hypothetical protein
VSRTTARLRLNRERGVPSIVVLGSSQVAQGVDCPLLGERLGKPCLNLGINGGSPLDAVFLLDRLGPASRVTVLGLFPRVLHTAPKRPFSDLSTLGCVLRTAAFRLTWEDWRLILFGELQDLSETLRNKDSLARLVAYHGDHLLDAWRGRLEPPPEYLLPEESSPFFVEHVDVQTFSDAQERAVGLIAERERRQGNRLVVVDFPRRSGYERFLTPQAAARYGALFETLSRTPGVLVLRRSELPAFADADFMDMTHLKPEGRETLTAALAAAIGSGGS